MKLSEFTPLDWAVLVIGTLLSIICLLIWMLAAKVGMMLVSPAPFLLAVLFLQWHQMQVVKERFRFTLTAMATIVDYHVETRKVSGRNSPTYYYQIWKPVVAFETERGTVKADYPFWATEPWYTEKEEYEIHYNPEQPEYFYFTERTDEYFGEFRQSFRIAVFACIGYVIVLLMCGGLLNSLFGM